MPAKTKLDQPLIDHAKALLQAGNHDDATARAVGVNPATWFRWLKRGAQAFATVESGVDLPLDEHPYLAFYTETLAAKARAETGHLEIIYNAAFGPLTESHEKFDKDGKLVERKVFQKPGDWRASAWWFEHGPGKEFWAGSAHLRLDDIHDAESKPLTEEQAMSDEAKAQMAKILHMDQKRRRGDSPTGTG
jgi:hypothetical protein